jgi:HSP20 family protein
MTNMTRYSPFREILAMRDEMDRLFEDAFGNQQGARLQETGNFGFPVDVHEDQHGYTIEASIPGIQPEDLDISITENVLTISGQSKAEQSRESGRYHVRERRFGRFSRTITLPQGIRADAVEADYENGILRIQVPKAEEVKPRRISVGNRPSSQTIDAQASQSGTGNSARVQSNGGQSGNGQSGKGQPDAQQQAGYNQSAVSGAASSQGGTSTRGTTGPSRTPDE